MGKVINMRVRLKNNAKDIDAYSIPLEFYNYPIKIVNETKDTYILECKDKRIQLYKHEVEIIKP